MKSIKCGWCGEEHEKDSTGWIQTCLGYIPEYLTKLSYDEMVELNRIWMNLSRGRRVE